MMRIGTFSTFSRVLLGMRSNQLAGLRASEQLSTGRRLLRPSDDPAGTSRSLALRLELSRSERTRAAVGVGRSQLEAASSTLAHDSELLTRARELLLQAMNGTLTDKDRRVVAAELGEIRKQLLADANLEVDGSFVFGGTRVGDKPWTEVNSGNTTHAIYRGNAFEHTIQAGEDTPVAITIAGNQVFGRSRPGAVSFDGLTGVSSGLTADEGLGNGYLVFRHDATEASTLESAGLLLVDGGDDDTLLGANTLRLDAAAGTLQLGSGQVVHIPEAGARTDVVVRNEKGGELHLDLGNWSGADYSGTVTGAGSVSFDGDDFTALTFTETDLELAHAELGQVVHVDVTAVRRAGSELVTFGDTTNPFDLLQGVLDDLGNDQGLTTTELQGRLSQRLERLDSVHDELLLGLGVVGARTARLINADERQGQVGLELSGRLSKVEDADLAEVALDLSRSQLLLQVAQAAGARVIQTSLLNFLG